MCKALWVYDVPLLPLSCAILPATLRKVSCNSPICRKGCWGSEAEWHTQPHSWSVKEHNKQGSSSLLSTLPANLYYCLQVGHKKAQKRSSLHPPPPTGQLWCFLHLEWGYWGILHVWRDQCIPPFSTLWCHELQDTWALSKVALFYPALFNFLQVSCENCSVKAVASWLWRKWQGLGWNVVWGAQERCQWAINGQLGFRKRDVLVPVEESQAALQWLDRKRQDYR